MCVVSLYFESKETNNFRQDVVGMEAITNRCQTIKNCQILLTKLGQQSKSIRNR